MNPLKMLKNKFLGKKDDKKASDPVSKILSAKAKVVKYGILASVAFFAFILITVIAFISYLLGFVQKNVDRISNLLSGACILCTTEELEQMKEDQFYTKIRIIKEVGGEKINATVLASTVLFRAEYNDTMDELYDEDFDEDTFFDAVEDFFNSLSVTGSDSYSGIDQETIDLLDAATLIMYNSNVDGKYDEDSYKEALTQPGFGSDNFLVNGISCATSVIVDVGETILQAIPLFSAITGSGNVFDGTRNVVNTLDICQSGFIEGTFDGISDISDEDVKERKKKQIAQNIIDFAAFYDELFPESSSSSSTGSVCYYSVSYIDEEISNLKVQTIQCESGNKSGSAYDDTGESLIDFENVYIPGVVYAEYGSADDETLKVQAVAARSYALTRYMPTANIGITLEDGQWVLRIRTCTSDQVFCHPILGCHSITGSMQGTTSGGDTVYAGSDDNGNYTRSPISSDSTLISTVLTTKGEVALDSSGAIVNTGYVSDDQLAWSSMAAEGMDYKSILISHYSSVTSVESDCRGGSGVYTTEQLEEYVQLSAAASVTNNDANTDLASTEYGSIEGFSQHIEDSVNNAGYGTREGVVAAGVSLIGDYIKATGKRIRYDQASRHAYEVEGIVNSNLYFDCSSFVWWALYNGGFNVPTYAYTGSQKSWASENGYLKTPGSGVGQAGDFLISDGHIMLIIGTYDDGYYVAHASSWTEGLKINKLSYSSARSAYQVIDMTDYYNDSSNVR